MLTRLATLVVIVAAPVAAQEYLGPSQSAKTELWLAVLGVAASVAATFLTAAVHRLVPVVREIAVTWIEHKIGHDIPESLERRFDQAARDAVRAAEVWARSQVGKKVAGSEQALKAESALREWVARNGLDERFASLISEKVAAKYESIRGERKP